MQSNRTVEFSIHGKYVLIFLIFALCALAYETRPIKPLKVKRIPICGLAKGNQRYFMEIDGHCYYIPPKLLNWFEALHHCLRQGLSLANLADEKHVYILAKHLRQNHMVQEYWFGANALDNSKHFWYVANGANVTNFIETKVMKRDTPDKKCVKLNVHSGLTFMESDHCDVRHYAICEGTK